jgi:hypothetical protein
MTSVGRADKDAYRRTVDPPLQPDTASTARHTGDAGYTTTGRLHTTNINTHHDHPHPQNQVVTHGQAPMGPTRARAKHLCSGQQ